MKIGLILTSIGNFGNKKFYNSQEIGLSKALSKLYNEVILYKLVDKKSNKSISTESLENYENVTVHYIPAKRIGTNGLMRTDILDSTLDVLVYFSDTQISVSNVYRWAKKKNILLFPYIGVLDSHSSNAYVRFIMNLITKLNIAIYRKCHCLAKTPAIECELRDYGVEKVTLLPVGLDTTVLNNKIESINKDDIKKKYNYSENDKVILFIGRLVDEKQPLKMIDIFSKVFKLEEGYRLMMVGQGPLYDEVLDKIKLYELEGYVRIIPRVLNSDIWELYRMAECFVNLNQQEIFGMAILEAMYYGCTTIAWSAPGPNYIIDSNINGYIAKDDEEVIRAIMKKMDYAEASKSKILNNFTWDISAKTIKQIQGI